MSTRPTGVKRTTVVKGAGTRAGAEATAAAAAPRATASVLAPPPLSHPAMLLGLLVLLASILVGTYFETTDTDFWQHIAVGRVIWTEHRLPMTNEWTWPTYGTPQVLPSWFFRVLLWPFWQAGGMWGMQAWRWLTTLGAFTLIWLTARRLGGRGFAALALIAWCLLVYRTRVYMRPETLAAVFLALTAWVLEKRRAGAGDHSWWLVALAWVWANAHISYWMLFLLVGIHLFAEFFDRVKRRPPLLWVGLAAAAACFVNPFGWHTLAEPFLYATVWRNEPAFRTIGELRSVDWKFMSTTGYIALLPLWPVLIALRARRRGWDMVELLCCAVFSVLGLWNQRFVSTWAVVAAPFVARDAAAFAAGIAWPAVLRSPWTRAALMAAVVIGGSVTDWRRTDLPLGNRVQLNSYPGGACEYMAAHDIRGRGFNHFEFGGYMLWRFWPERDRRPFLDVHLTGSPEDRRLSGYMLDQPEAWRLLDNKYRFPFALMRRLHGVSDVSLDIIEADSGYALVFLDDAAALYLRRDGPYAALADSDGFRITRAGRVGMGEMGRAMTADTSLRAVVRAELGRMVRSSPANSGAHSILGQMDIVQKRWSSARENILAAYAVDPLVPMFHERIGITWWREGRTAEAKREFELAVRKEPTSTAWSWLGEACAATGDAGKAKQSFRRALELDPGNDKARVGLEKLGSS